MMKFDRMSLLTGKNNYRRWAGSWQIAFDSLGLWEIITGESPEPPSSQENDHKIWKAANKHLRAVLLNAVDEDLQSFVIDNPTPKYAWEAL